MPPDPGFEGLGTSLSSLTARGEVKSVQFCGLGLGSDFHTLWKLPKLPLTEMFGPFDPNFPAFDQELVISINSGLVQLRNQIPPMVLYSDSVYTYRTALSPKTGRDLEFFTDFLDKHVGSKKFRSLVDIGGNDFALARRLQVRAASVAVVDPICKSLDGKTVDGVSVVGRFLESVDLRQIGPPPDLVVCRHTLEHVPSPVTFVRQIIEQSSDDCMFVFEVPSFDSMLESKRFDAVFHQHLHYFDLVTFRRLLDLAGGEIVSHESYLRGPCGGSLLVAFRKGPTKKVAVHPSEIGEKIERIETALKQFREQMSLMAQLFNDLPGPVFGYGAGLMLATFAYHLGEDLKRLDCVLDDDPEKHGMTYRNLPVVVKHPGRVQVPAGSSFLVTSLENQRVLTKKILEMLPAPRRLLVPHLL
jgi:2-polyprenyl-3-methyl-5-hydroxy-6-metoxy-1,4-benzoquinol methylase